MKLRYLFLVFLVFGALLFAALSLVLEVLEVVEHPAHHPAALAVSENRVTSEQPAAQAGQVADGNTAAPAAAPAAATVQTPATYTVPATKQPAKNPYNAQKLQEIRQKYAAAQPTEWNEYVRGMVHKVNVPQSNEQTLFLTFNVYTRNQPELFDFLQQHHIKATIFLSGAWVRRNAEQARKIGALPALFEIGNHGNSNKPLSASGAAAYERKGTASLAAAIDDVEAGAEAVKNATGQTPRYLRPFFNYTDNVVVEALNEAGIKTIGVSVLADGGGLFATEKIKTQILNAPNGSIILLSINPDFPNIFNGLKAAIEEIERQELPIRFEHLATYESSFIYW
jgi:peptidoglycan/xylan/chitin deacetylase (PgdA/CDA1 family)